MSPSYQGVIDLDPTPIPSSTALTETEAIENVTMWAELLPDMTAEEMIKKLQQIDDARVLDDGVPPSNLDFAEIVRKYAPNAPHEKPVAAPTPIIVPNDGPALARDYQTAEPKPWQSFGKAMPNWWMSFSGFDDLEEGGIKMYVENFIPEGVTIISSLPKEGKT